MRIIAAPYDWRTENAIIGYHLPVGCVGSMDLRPLPDQGDKPRPGSRNLGLFVLPDELPLPSDAKAIPEHWTLADRRWLQSALGHKRTPQADTLAGVINWLRTEGADPSGESAMKPAMPDHRGMLEWRLGDLHHREKWTPRHRASVDLFKRVHSDIMEQSAPLHRKFLGASVIKTGVDFRTLLYKRMWGETPLQPTTVISETFSGTSSTIGNDHTWTERASTFETVSGRVRRTSTADTTPGTYRSAYNTTNLSSDDMIVRWTVPTHTDGGASGNQCGVTARDATGATTYYVCFTQIASGAGYGQFLFKVVAGSFTSIGTANSLVLSAPHYPTLLVDGSVQLSLGTNVGAGSDTAITGETKGGIYMASLSGTTAVEGDSWEARDMVETASGGGGGVRNPFRGPIG